MSSELDRPREPAPAPEARRILVAAEDTDYRYTLVALTLPPFDQGTPFHTHPANVEGCYVLEGTLAVSQGDHTITLTANGAVHIRAGVSHSAWNPTAAPTTVLLIYTPGVASAMVEAVVAGAPDDAPGYEDSG
jgi:mannose-6-phosphate isomerase-like protein (cupin superfamily)